MDGKIIEQENITSVVRLLAKCKSVLFITGAGISADSGLPTYRGVSGLYNNKSTDDGMPIEMALSGDTLRTKPAITWKYIVQIEGKCRGATYNRGHEVIAQMEQHFDRVWVLTQNVDGFHQAAGSQNVINIHGDIRHLICSSCSWEKKVKDYSTLLIPPTCPECTCPVRPNVVFFGEMLPQEQVDLLSIQLEKGFDIYFSIGTTAVFPYIMQPLLMASYSGQPTVEINPDRSEISSFVDIKISLGAAEALDKIWNLFLKENQ